MHDRKPRRNGAAMPFPCCQSRRLLFLAAILAGLNLALAPWGFSAAPRSAVPQNDGEAPLGVGFVYVGAKDDYGLNQAHAAGAAAVKKMKGVTIFEKEDIPEDQQSRKVMEEMIEKNKVSILFGTSYGYFKPHMAEAAQDHPKVTFLHNSLLWNEKEKHPRNLGCYFGYMEQCQYLAGIVAGHTTRSKKVGFVAAKPIPNVLRDVNAFTLGARSVDPKIECHILFTGAWSDPKKEVVATKVLLDKGVDVLTFHVDAPKAIVETANAGKCYVCGYHISQKALAPERYLTGAEWNWEKVYVDYVTKVQKGEKVANVQQGGLKEGLIKMSPYGPAVSAAARKAADAVKEQMLAGTFVVFKGPLKDNTGNEVIAKGKEYPSKAADLERMDYLVEGVVGNRK